MFHDRAFRYFYFLLIMCIYKTFIYHEWFQFHLLLVRPEILTGMSTDHWICVVIWVTGFVPCRPRMLSSDHTFAITTIGTLCVATAVISMLSIWPEESILFLFYPINRHSSQPVSLVAAHPWKYLWWDHGPSLFLLAPDNIIYLTNSCK